LVAHDAPPEKAALSRELADFLIELSIALHKHAMYPEGTRHSRRRRPG